MLFARKNKAAAVKDGAFDPRIYDVLRRPVVTEKSTALSEANKVVFDVATSATKSDVKAAVEAIFKVEVVGVNTLNRKGKTKQFRGRAVPRSDSKRAVVTLKSGQSIDMAAGVR